MNDWLVGADWGGVFRPDAPVLEIVVRGSVVYLALFALLRFVLKREAGTLAITDLLVVVLIADAAQNAMADDYRSLPDGLLLVATIVFWSYALDWLGFRFPRLRPLVRPRPLPLVKDGRMLRQNMRRELVTEDELMSQLRLHGCDDVSRVKEAYMEGDGRISVILRDGQGKESPERPAI